MDEPPVEVEEGEKMKDALREILATANLVELTKSQALRQLEQTLGKEEGSLEEMQAHIGELVDTLMQEKQVAAALEKQVAAASLAAVLREEELEQSQVEQERKLRSAGYMLARQQVNPESLTPNPQPLTPHS